MFKNTVVYRVACLVRCPWSHVRSKHLLHISILGRLLPFQVGSIRICIIVHQNHVYTRQD